jgi:hypothetical protein
MIIIMTISMILMYNIMAMHLVTCLTPIISQLLLPTIIIIIIVLIIMWVTRQNIIIILATVEVVAANRNHIELSKMDIQIHNY